MSFQVQCHPAGTGVPSQAPCVDVDGQAYVPVLVQLPIDEYDYIQGGEFFAWGVTGVVLVWVTGLVVGAIMRVIKSAL